MDLTDKIKLIKEVKILDVFNEIYPNEKISSELNPFHKKKVYRAFCKFIPQKGSPSMYLDEKYFACYHCGNRGNSAKLLRRKMKSSTINYSEKNLIRKLGKIANISLSEKEIIQIKNEEEDFDQDYDDSSQIHFESNHFEGTAICFSTHGNTSKNTFRKERLRVWKSYSKYILKSVVPKIKFRFSFKKNGEDLPF